MDDNKNMRILRGNQRFAGSPSGDIKLTPFIESDKRTLIQGDRNKVLNLVEQFQTEREYCSTYRFYGKIDMVYNNVITGRTEDTKFLNSMYFLPDWQGCRDVTIPNYPVAYGGPPCDGIPPSMAFSMIPPEDYGSSERNTVYNELTSYQDNWVLYISYVCGTDSGQTMQYYSEYSPNSGMQFKAGDGIPFIMSEEIGGRSTIVRLTTPVPHGLKPGDYIELQQSAANGGNITPIGGGTIIDNLPIDYVITGTTYTTSQYRFKVDSIGSVLANSKDYVINLLVKSVGTTNITQNCLGTSKRIANISYPIRSKSIYYVHKHMLVTNPQDYTLDRTGFEFGIYKEKGRHFKSKKTPDGYPKKTIIRQEFESYLWNINKDIDREMYRDNLGRPVGDYHLTILPVNRNLLWHYQAPANSPAGYGWDWNFRKDGNVDPFVNNDTNPTNLTQTTTDGVSPLPVSGDTYRGAFVEYNPFDLEEKIISNISHSLKFNKGNGADDYMANDSGGLIESIYQYSPHNIIPVRKFAKSINTETQFSLAPQYAFYSTVESKFMWRPVLPISVYDTDTNGVDYPYLNNAHYPYKELEFTIKPIGPVLIDCNPNLDSLLAPCYTSETITQLAKFSDGCQ
jgi:hypothetical protein